MFQISKHCSTKFTEDTNKFFSVFLLLKVIVLDRVLFNFYGMPIIFFFFGLQSYPTNFLVYLSISYYKFVRSHISVVKMFLTPVTHVASWNVWAAVYGEACVISSPAVCLPLAITIHYFVVNAKYCARWNKT